MGFVESLPMLIFVRGLDGAMSATIGTAQAVIADLTVPSERAKFMGFVGSASGLGVIAGPALGGVLTTWQSFRFTCIFGACISMVNFILAIIYLKESNPPEKRRAKQQKGSLLDASGAELPKKKGICAILRENPVLDLTTPHLEHEAFVQH